MTNKMKDDIEIFEKWANVGPKLQQYCFHWSRRMGFAQWAMPEEEDLMIQSKDFIVSFGMRDSGGEEAQNCGEMAGKGGRECAESGEHRSRDGTGNGLAGGRGQRRPCGGAAMSISAPRRDSLFNYPPFFPASQNATSKQHLSPSPVDYFLLLLVLIFSI